MNYIIRITLGLAFLATLSLQTLWSQNQSLAQDGSAAHGSSVSATPAALKIVKLLWNSKPAGAAATLRKTLEQTLNRGGLAELKPHLQALDQLWAAVPLEATADPRWGPALAARLLAHCPDPPKLAASPANPSLPNAAAPTSPKRDSDEQAVSHTNLNNNLLSTLQRAITTDPLEIGQREFLFRVWLVVEPPVATHYLQATLLKPNQSPEQSEWMEVLTLRGLEHDGATTAQVLLDNWAALPKPVQLVAIEPLTHTAPRMKLLVSAIEAGRVPKDLLNTNHLVKWTTGEHGELTSAIERVWGRMRSIDAGDRKQVVERTLQLLASGKAGDPVAGQMHFRRICAQCHRLHGEGLDVGPDITSNGRGNFEQLVSNVMDPSLVIGKAFTAKTVLASDGRVVSGVVAAEDQTRLTLKVQGGKLIEFDREEEIDEIRESDKSLMPDGLEQQMTEQELLELFAYLSLTQPLTAQENATIPGTPETLLP